MSIRKYSYAKQLYIEIDVETFNGFLLSQGIVLYFLFFSAQRKGSEVQAILSYPKIYVESRPLPTPPGQMFHPHPSLQGAMSLSL